MHQVLKDNGTLFSYFAPIYSHLVEGDHHVIGDHPSFKENPIGLHLLTETDQSKKLISLGVDSQEERKILLKRINHNRIPPRQNPGRRGN